MAEPSSPTPFDPTTQSFTLTAANGSTVTISLAIIEAQRRRLANTTINYGVQLGLCLLSLMILLLLLPSHKFRRALPATQLAAIVVSVIRLVLLVLYFPGPLAAYYVAWTRDASVLRSYLPITVGNVFAALQSALVEAALVMQSWALVRTWRLGSSAASPPPLAAASSSVSGPPSSRAPVTTTTLTTERAGRWGRGRIGEMIPIRLVVLSASMVLATAAVVLKVLWAVHFTRQVKGNVLPLPLDGVGKAAVALAAVSIFFFEGVFVSHIVGHLLSTRAVLRSGGRGGAISWRLRSASDESAEQRRRRRTRVRGLSNLEILAVGNGVLMVLPSLFAGLDIAAGPGNTKVLPFDAGSWVQTIVASGLPLIGLVAFYRGSDTARGPRAHRRRVSLFAATDNFRRGNDAVDGNGDGNGGGNLNGVRNGRGGTGPSFGWGGEDEDYDEEDIRDSTTLTTSGTGCSPRASWRGDETSVEAGGGGTAMYEVGVGGDGDGDGGGEGAVRVARKAGHVGVAGVRTHISW